METDYLDQQLSFWNRLLYVVLGASIAILVSSFDQILSIVWLVLQLTVTATAFFLLRGKRWRNLPPSEERTYTTFGYFLASWLLSLFPGLMGADPLYYILVLGYGIFILIIFRRQHKALAVTDEMFP